MTLCKHCGKELEPFKGKIKSYLWQHKDRGLIWCDNQQTMAEPRDER